MEECTTISRSLCRAKHGQPGGDIRTIAPITSAAASLTRASDADDENPSTEHAAISFSECTTGRREKHNENSNTLSVAPPHPAHLERAVSCTNSPTQTNMEYREASKLSPQLSLGKGKGNNPSSQAQDKRTAQVELQVWPGKNDIRKLRANCSGPKGARSGSRKHPCGSKAAKSSPVKMPETTSTSTCALTHHDTALAPTDAPAKSSPVEMPETTSTSTCVLTHHDTALAPTDAPAKSSPVEMPETTSTSTCVLTHHDTALAPTDAPAKSSPVEMPETTSTSTCVLTHHDTALAPTDAPAKSSPVEMPETTSTSTCVLTHHLQRERMAAYPADRNGYPVLAYINDQTTHPCQGPFPVGYLTPGGHTPVLLQPHYLGTMQYVGSGQAQVQSQLKQAFHTTTSLNSFSHDSDSSVVMASHMTSPSCYIRGYESADAGTSPLPMMIPSPQQLATALPMLSMVDPYGNTTPVMLSPPQMQMVGTFPSHGITTPVMLSPQQTQANLQMMGTFPSHGITTPVMLSPQQMQANFPSHGNNMESMMMSRYRHVNQNSHSPPHAYYQSHHHQQQHRQQQQQPPHIDQLHPNQLPRQSPHTRSRINSCPQLGKHSQQQLHNHHRSSQPLHAQYLQKQTDHDMSNLEHPGREAPRQHTSYSYRQSLGERNGGLGSNPGAAAGMGTTAAGWSHCSSSHRRLKKPVRGKDRSAAAVTAAGKYNTAEGERIVYPNLHYRPAAGKPAASLTEESSATRSTQQSSQTATTATSSPPTAPAVEPEVAPASAPARASVGADVDASALARASAGADVDASAPARASADVDDCSAH